MPLIHCVFKNRFDPPPQQVHLPWSGVAYLQ
jgi:hypothetical protein